MRTTIQVHKTIKDELDELKVNQRETYEDIIVKLLTTMKQKQMMQIKELEEGYLEMAEDSIEIAKEWAVTEADFENLDSKTRRVSGDA